MSPELRPCRAVDDIQVQAACRELGLRHRARDAVTVQRTTLVLDHPPRIGPGRNPQRRPGMVMPVTIPASWWYAGHSWPTGTSAAQHVHSSTSPRIALLLGEGQRGLQTSIWPGTRTPTLVLSINADAHRRGATMLTDLVKWTGRRSSPVPVDLSRVSVHEWLAWLASLDLAVFAGSDGWHDAVAVGTPALCLDAGVASVFKATSVAIERALDQRCALCAEQRVAQDAVEQDSAIVPNSVASLNALLSASGRATFDRFDDSEAIRAPVRPESVLPTPQERRRGALQRQRRKLRKLRQSPRRFFIDAWQIRRRSRSS